MERRWICKRCQAIANDCDWLPDNKCCHCGHRERVAEIQRNIGDPWESKVQGLVAKPHACDLFFVCIDEHCLDGDTYLWKTDLQLHQQTTSDTHQPCSGEWPGYWTSLEEAEAAITAYEAQFE